MTAFSTVASSSGVAPGSITVASHACGAPAKVLGENTITKLIDSDSHSTLRKLTILAVMLRPSTLTVTLSPIFNPSSRASSAENDTSGSPLWSGAHQVPSARVEFSGLFLA
ncbi:hypothetical protein D3C72_2034760 [compost metagenome]